MLSSSPLRIKVSEEWMREEGGEIIVEDKNILKVLLSRETNLRSAITFTSHIIPTEATAATYNHPILVQLEDQEDVGKPKFNKELEEKLRAEKEVEEDDLEADRLFNIEDNKYFNAQSNEEKSNVGYTPCLPGVGKSLLKYKFTDGVHDFSGFSIKYICKMKNLHVGDIFLLVPPLLIRRGLFVFTEKNILIAHTDILEYIN